MSGHSKWATTKHKKAVVDAKRSKVFAKLIKNIEVAARLGGGDPDANPTLYDAIYKAKKTSVPNDNIDRAVKRGSGAAAGGADYQTIMYEGYAPGGVAVLVECLTDNRNRAAAEVRTAMTRAGGSRTGRRSIRCPLRSATSSARKAWACRMHCASSPNTPPAPSGSRRARARWPRARTPTSWSWTPASRCGTCSPAAAASSRTASRS